jgi:hypothetical protein
MQHSISNGIVERNDAFDMFVDNCTAILKGIQERPREQASDALRKTPELPRLIFMLAHYADEMSGAIADRCRSRIVSQLADGVDCSTFNNVSKASLLLIIESWMEAQVTDGISEQRKPYASHVRGKSANDGDHLKALVRLSDRCTFDAESVRDSRMTPAQLFASHMDFFTRHALRVSQANSVSCASKDCGTHCTNCQLRSVSPQSGREHSSACTVEANYFKSNGQQRGLCHSNRLAKASAS